MTWTRLQSSLNTKPHVLAGPILRTVTPTSVTVWLALRVGAKVTLIVLDEQNAQVMRGERRTVAIGSHLHIVAVTAKLSPPHANLSEGIVYQYDLFFDFEGDPLWTDDGADWGLEYLFGVLEGGRSCAFHPLWAHNRREERQALIDFLALVAKRRRRFPNMHIYHYAAYEKTALLRLAGRHGVGEDEVDELLQRPKPRTC